MCPLPKAFEYFAPENINEALDLLNRFKDKAKILAGGQSLIPLMKYRLLSPEYVIDLRKLKDLIFIKEKDQNRISIGALTTYIMIEFSPLIEQKCPLLKEVTNSLSDLQVKNRGTIGGSICHADPAAHYPPAMLALNAQFKLMSKENGERIVNAEDFFIDAYTTLIKPDEILTEIEIDAFQNDFGWGFEYLNYGGAGYPIVIAITILKMRNDVCEDVRIALGGVSLTPIRAKIIESSLKGEKLNSEIIDKIIFEKMEEMRINPPSDIHASSEYRKEMAKVLTRRAIKKALKRLKGDGV
ncbi:MAG: xanthine dehydrogenase family protein subunit M [Nitrososphaerales archaeon]